MLIIGEKINGTRKLVNKAVLERDADFIRNLALAQVEGGADVLDVNAGTESSREPDDVRWLVQIVQDAVDKPLCLDSPNPAALLAGLETARQLPMVNSISLEEDKINGVLPIVAQYGCRVLAVAVDGSIIAQTCEARMAIVRRLFDLTRKAGVRDENLYVDPLVMSVATDPQAANVTLATMRGILSEYPKAHLTGGLSNVSFGLPVRSILNRAFLTLAIEAGLDSMIVDPTDRGLMETMYATYAILGQDRLCGKFTKAYRNGRIGPRLEERKAPAAA